MCGEPELHTGAHICVRLNRRGHCVPHRRVTFLEALQPAALEGDPRVFCHIWSGGTVSALAYDDLYRGSVR
jgi:hypothetical protein